MPTLTPQTTTLIGKPQAVDHGPDSTEPLSTAASYGFSWRIACCSRASIIWSRVSSALTSESRKVRRQVSHKGRTTRGG